MTTSVGDVFEADLSCALEWHLWAFGAVERHFAELFGLLVRPGDRCLDVGANIGLHTIRLARLAGREGEVIGFEPDPELARRAGRNVAINGLDNDRLIAAAASDQPGELRLYRPGPYDTNRGRASLMHHAYLTGATATVPVVTIDDVCAGAPVALIKIDVEGLESAVVRGAAETITRHSPAIVFEFAPPLLEDPVGQTPFGWLADRGYLMFSVRPAKNGITGRVRLALDRLTSPPAGGGDILAVPPPMLARLRALAN